ncbi:MAG TPA: 7TM diverse intracellular signaling domain-containing protein, partial [Pseudomonadales bacterium]|nr:7TM diverse intracellular signaling domain-containing protein [Pseudomonadales bacterium]
RVDYLEDPTGQASLADVKRQTAWQAGQTDALNFGFTHSAYWIRLPLRTGAIQANFLLQVEYALLDVAELFVEQNGQIIQHYRAGNAIEFAQRPLKHRTILYPLALQPEQNYMLYARFAGNVSVQLPLIIWQQKDFWEQDQFHTILQGLYFGVLTIMAVYNLFMYFSLREKVHLVYVTMVSGVMLFMLSFRGIGFAYLWTDQLWWNERVISFVIPFATGCFVWFANEFLHAKQLAPRLYRVQTSCMMISFLLCMASLILQPNTLTPVNSAWVVVSFVGIGVLSSTLLRRDRAARFFAAAYLTFIFGGIVLALSKFGLIEYSFTSENSLQFGSMLEAFLLSVAIAERVRMLQMDKLKAMEAEMAARDEAFKLAEREMRVQMESRAKSEFLASMSHEIRTPMNGVLGLAELLKETPLNEQQREYLNTLSNSGRALLTVINDILDYSKVDAGKVKLEKHEFDLHELIEETLSLFMPQIKASGVKLFAFVDEPVARKWVGDSHRLRQVLVNLLGNAFKFTERGAVKLNVRLEEGGVRPQLRFDVVDTGVGLSSEQAARLFQSYSQADSSITRKYGGTGLGLAISKRLVELMGGEIGVSSTLNVGSCFWFTVAMQSQDTAVEGGPSIEETAQHLIVSADSMVKQTLRQNLLMLGGTVLSFESVREFHQRAASLGNAIKSVFVQTEEGLSDAFMHALEAMHPEKIVILGNAQANAAGAPNYIHLPYPVTTHRIKQIFRDPDKAPVAPIKTSAVKAIALRVLVAEDNKVNQMVIRGLLRQFSIEPVIVENGKEVVARYQATPTDFDLILMDCEMPEMDGYQAAAAIRRWEQEQGMRPVTISALTAHILEEHRRQAEQAGMNEHLAKPIDKAALERVLRRLAREVAV